jgi:transcriptional regulator with XRE-family HTH domain
MGLRKLEGTHKFLSMFACDRCGFKTSYDSAGRSVMRDHLSAKHPESGVDGHPVSAILPARLVEAREYVGFTVAEVAGALGCPASVIEQIEAGGATITGEHLRKLSRLYRRPVKWFSDEVPFEPSPELLRQVEGLGGHDREAVLDFAEFLQGAGKPAAVRREQADGG